jgi:hypothetical protein
MGSKAAGLPVYLLFVVATIVFCVAVLVVLPQLGNLWSRELRLLGQVFATFVNLELGNQG